MCAAALITEIPVKEIFSFGSFPRKYIVSILRIPPAREMKPELTPDKRAAKPAFMITIDIAGIMPCVEQANITIILEKPNFIPIGKGKAESRSLSMNESANARAARIEVNVSLKILLFFISVCYGIGSVAFCAGYLYYSFIRNTHGHIPCIGKLSAIYTVFSCAV